MSRTAYVVTMDAVSPQASFVTNLLRKTGFKVEHVKPILNTDLAIANKLTIQEIYKRIIKSGEYGYIFEDDINVHEDVQVDEIMLYEQLSPRFFYLGVCTYGDCEIAKKLRMETVKGKNVWVMTTGVRGLHAVGVSPIGASELLECSEKDDEKYMDVIMEKYCEQNPTNSLRYEFESSVYGHRGLFYKDYDRFHRNKN